MNKLHSLAHWCAVMVLCLPTISFSACNNDDDDADDGGSGKVVVVKETDENEYFDGLLYYNITSNVNKTAQVKGVEDNCTEVEIPEKISVNGEVYTITGIGDRAFYIERYLTNVTLPKTIETIDRLAFANCDRLTAISLPDKVRHIGSESFEYCESLTSIHLPESVEEIEYSAFFYCRNLSYINLPAGLKYLDFSAFSDCINLDIYSYVVNPDQLSYDNGLGDYIMFYVPKGTMEAYIDRFPWLSDQIREMD